MTQKILFILSLFLLVACNGRLNQGGAIELISTEPAPFRSEEITFQIVQTKVLNQQCLMCHSKVGGNKGDINLETYEKVFENLKSIRREVISRDMPDKPANPLTEAQIDLIIRWIDAGAPEKK